MPSKAARTNVINHFFSLHCPHCDNSDWSSISPTSSPRTVLRPAYWHSIFFIMIFFPLCVWNLVVNPRLMLILLSFKLLTYLPNCPSCLLIHFILHHFLIVTVHLDCWSNGNRSFHHIKLWSMHLCCWVVCYHGPCLVVHHGCSTLHQPNHRLKHVAFKRFTAGWHQDSYSLAYEKHKNVGSFFFSKSVFLVTILVVHWSV